MKNGDFITRAEFSERLEKIETNLKENFLKLDDRFDDLLSLFNKFNYETIDQKHKIKKENEKSMTARISTVVAAIVFLLGSIGTVGKILLDNQNERFSKEINFNRTISDLKNEILTTKINGIEKQMDEEFDWIYETKPNNETIEFLEKEIEKLKN